VITGCSRDGAGAAGERGSDAALPLEYDLTDTCALSTLSRDRDAGAARMAVCAGARREKKQRGAQ
jgi:hypothetical protein